MDADYNRNESRGWLFDQAPWLKLRNKYPKVDSLCKEVITFYIAKPPGCDCVTVAASQCWSVGKEVAIPLEIRLIVQRVRAPHG